MKAFFAYRGANAKRIDIRSVGCGAAQEGGLANKCQVIAVSLEENPVNEVAIFVVDGLVEGGAICFSPCRSLH